MGYPSRLEDNARQNSTIEHKRAESLQQPILYPLHIPTESCSCNKYKGLAVKLMPSPGVLRIGINEQHSNYARYHTFYIRLVKAKSSFPSPAPCTPLCKASTLQKNMEKDREKERKREACIALIQIRTYSCIVYWKVETLFVDGFFVFR